MGFVSRIAKLLCAAFAWTTCGAFITALWLLLYCSAAWPADMPRLSSVTTTDKFVCVPCKRLEDRLTAQRVHLVRACSSHKKYAPNLGFPTCRYSDGHKDNGQRVYAGSCSLAGSVYWITWMEKERK